MPNNGENTNKLVGSLYLELDQLKADVKAANDLQSSIGKNIKLDIGKTLEQQIKSSLDSVSKDLMQKVKDIQNISSTAKPTATSSTPEFDVMKVKEQTDAVGNLTSVIVEGMDTAGTKIRQTIKDGEQLSTTYERLGEEAKIWKQIEEEQKAAQKAESDLWKQIIAEEKQAKSEESAIMKDLIAEQNQYISMQKKIEKIQEKRSREGKQRDYSLLFDELDQKDVNSYINSLENQIRLTQELNKAQINLTNSRNQKSKTEYSSAISDLRLQLQNEKKISEEIIKRNPSIKNNANVISKIKELTSERKKGEKELTELQKEHKNNAQQVQTVYDQIIRSITHILTSAVSNALSTFWRDALEYAKSYYDQLNEIRIVTGKSEEDANRMGKSYREMASAMSVSSSEIANAAVEFWRQGLNETEVNSRLTSTIQYAKISSLEFKDAAEQMTAATNGMGLSASHVADVWAYLGDASASGADEIGTAMQKVAATAGEAGLSFEWLGAYIATISEKTRQAPEVIGTSLNSIISRIQSIKEKGYNEEDETKINDIAKALNTIDVALMDNEGNWRNLNDIFMDIALQWGELDDKTRSYIATTVAGTRQKNYFLTLMDDLKNVSDSTGEASRAMELYEGALASAGTASKKYSIYQESITASQDKMNAAFEKLYSLLDSDVIKNWYEFWTQAAEGWAYILSGGDIKPTIDTTSVISDLDSEISLISPLIQEYNTLYETRGKTTEQVSRMKEIIEQLCSIYPPFQKTLQDSNGNYLSGAEAVRTMNDELEYAIELRRMYSKYNLGLSADDTAGLESVVSMRQNQNNMSSVFDLINQASELLGYGDASKLDQGKMNALGYTIDGQIERIINRLYPDPKMRDEIESAWNSFYKEYWDNMARGFNSARIASVNSVDDIANTELQNSARSIIDFFLEYESFDQLTDYAKTEARSIAAGIAEGITDADWEQGADYVHGMLYNKTQEALDMYKKIYTDVTSWVSSGSDENMTYNLEQEINAFNTLFGTAYTLESVIASITGDTKGLTTYTEELDDKVDTFYEKLMKLQKSAQIEQRHDAGWVEEINQIMDVLNSGDIDRITNMITEFGNEDNSDWFDKMEKDIPWLTEMQISMRDESGNILVTPETIQAAYSAAASGIAIANKEAENFRKTVASIKESYANDIGEKTGWSDVLDRLSGFTNMGSGWSDASWNNEGFANYLKELDNSGVLDKIVETFPYLKEFISLYVTELPDGTWTVNANAEAWENLGNNIERSKDSLIATLEAYREANKGVTDSEGQSALKDLNDAFSSGGWQGFNQQFNSYDSDMQAWLVKNSSAVLDYAEAWDEYSKAVENSGEESEDAKSAMDKIQSSAKKLRREVDKITFEELEDGQKVWKGFSDQIENAQGNGKEFSKTYGDMIGRVDDLNNALDALAYIQSSGEKDATALKNAYSDLASFSGVSADAQKNNLSPALWAIQSETDLASSTIANLISWISTMDGVTIDPSNIGASLARISSQSLGTASDVATLVMQMLQVAGASVSMGSDGVVRVNFPNSGNAGRYLANNQRASSGGRSGGGGGRSSGSSSASNQMSEIEKMLDMMEQIQDIREYQMKLISSTREYYETTGLVQGVIQCYEQERDALIDNNSVLESNIARIEALMRAKQAEVAAMSTSDSRYEQAADDLKALQQAHQQYTQQQIENQTAIAQFNQAIEDQHNKVRDMEIELRETILQAIKDREELEERMLQGRIDVENEIMNVIKSRYEKERDMIIEQAELQKSALEEELDLLDKQLDARKKLADKEDKQVKLAQLQAKLERISADPTRRKEELDLRKQIADLRDEMAWDLAEEEVEAQKDSINQQIDSLDEYIEYVENYYEELFKHPQRLIAEMQEVISGTDEQILEFLRNNSEEFANSTEAVQTDMINGWNDMLMDMHGSIETYWDEVEDIIAQGDEAIIQFLIDNSADYQAAGQLQAQKYVDEWRKQLEQLRLAHQEVTNEINNTQYTPVAPSTGGSSGSSGGTGGSGSPGGGTTTQKKYTFKFKNNKGSWSAGYTDKSLAIAFNKAQKAAISHWNQYKGQPGVSEVLAMLARASAYNPGSYIKQFAKGGLANFTGLAWLDGTKKNPERILSPYQTELFEDLIASLHSIRVSIPKIQSVGYDAQSNQNTFTFGDIIINVDDISTDDDYREIADRIMNEIMDKIGRGYSIGGIRFNK